MPQPIVILDLDGTLADTNRDLIPVLNRTIATQGVPPIPFESVGHVVGHGAKSMIAHAFRYHGRTVDDDALNALYKIYLADYEMNLAIETVLFDGVLESLDVLAGNGHLLAVCTNKHHGMAVKLLEELGIAGRFAAITGGDSFDFRKPDPRHLHETIRLAGGDARQAVMVGDSRTDIDAAKAAGIPVIAVDFGYTDVPVNLLGPDAVVSHYSEIAPAVMRLLSAQPMGRNVQPA